jgi:hypothetical protein
MGNLVASELFDICRALAQSPPGAASTRRLHEVLVLTAAEGCSRQGGAFGNLFAQVDYLGKRLGLDTELCISLQTARRHTNTGAPISAEDWPYDIMAVARLVAAVFKADVPGTLLSLLPTHDRPRPKGLRINMEYLRCIVNSVNDMYVLADTDDGQIAIDYRNTQDGRDFAYLQKLLRPGMQLNLLDSHIEENPSSPASTPPLPHVIPGIVVVEPDFLIDISSLAACFTNYGHHPLLYTLNRLKDPPNSQATLLGNFAGTALDDIITAARSASRPVWSGITAPPPASRPVWSGITAPPPPPAPSPPPPPASPLASSLQRSFREQALRYCACPDFDAEKFILQAEEQMKNIREAVAALPSLAAPSSSPLLEPSFICEHLGLQGRVDLMTSDMSLLVEQKSGRNQKIDRQSHDSHGLQLENHYVQLLLYYGVLRYNFGKTDRQVDMRLLYSRYPASKGLLTVNYYRTLLREAIVLRNKIVATELLIARDGFHRILPLLTPDFIYKDVRRDEHFHRYVLPEISLLTSHLSLLTPLERAYYERMLTFVYREQLADKLGSSESRLHHTSGCTADLWQMSLQEKVDKGNIIMSSSPPSTVNFRLGDMVYLYNYEGEPDVRKSILLKGSLLEMTADTVTVMLNNAQTPLTVHYASDGTRWAIEQGGSDVSTTSSIRSLHRFITSSPRRKALLLGQRPPEADTSLRLSHTYHPDYDDVLLRIQQARDYFLLVGPPGTGKTSMALRYIVEENLSQRLTGKGEGHAAAILLTAYTNRAVDEICAMLLNIASSLRGEVGEGLASSLGGEVGEGLASSLRGEVGGGLFLRLGKTASCDERFRPYLLDTALADTRKLDEARSLIDRTPIIVATTSMLQAQPWLLQIKHFSLAVVDEASQILEPAIIGLLASDAIDRFVLIGDHKQLPAVVQQPPGQSVVAEQCLRDIGLDDCRHSLFERLLRWERRQGRTQFVGTLHTHGRMHPDVARFPLQHFYQREQLQAVPLPHQQETSLAYDQPARDQLDELLKTRRLLFLSPAAEETVKGTAEDAAEETTEGTAEDAAEGAFIADLLARIYRFTASHFDPAKTVGVIVLYRRQIALIRQSLPPSLQGKLEKVSIDTVERYQGSQRDVIICDFSISHRYQLDFLTATTFTDDDGQLIDRKLNVALTRARRQVIVVGHPDLLGQVPLYRQLMEATPQP